MTMLERDDRDEYQKPDEVVRALGLEPGMRVADIGAGSGYFTRRIAPRVQPDGIVYALDIEEPFLARIRADAERFGIGNIRTVLTQPDRPDLPDDSVDMVLFVNTWHHIANPDAYLRHVRRILRPGGTFVHVDWKKMETPHGPPMDHRLSRDELYEEMKKGGFELRSEHFFLRWHYFLVFQDAGSR